LSKGEDYGFFEQWLGKALLLGSGERWHKTRKLLTPAFHFSKIEEYSETMDLHARVNI
jgi:cytochrome P450